MDYFEQREAEYQAAVAKQHAERKAEAQKERTKLKAEAEKITEAFVHTFPPPKTEVVDNRSFRDMVRDNLDNIPLAQRERWESERYHARRAAQEAASQKQQRGQADELGVDHLVNPPELDWDEINNDPDEYWDGDED